MQSSLIGKVQKAKQYALEPDRIRFQSLTVAFRGDNGDHQVTYDAEQWSCTCHFFAGWGICCHTMALERVLGPMMPVKQAYPEGLQQAATAVGAGA
ncbi:MAG: SWIM zinc finger family protein [Chloroflexota bacterium]|nr:SWIM zinc finger family protein [Chloroflexota bacterium]